MLKPTHDSHQGMDKCKARARMVLYWPGMSRAIEMITRQCHVCLRFRANNKKEPRLLREVPERPWQRAAADIMTSKGRDYLVAVDCYSIEIALLEYKTYGSLRNQSFQIDVCEIRNQESGIRKILFVTIITHTFIQ